MGVDLGHQAPWELSAEMTSGTAGGDDGEPAFTAGYGAAAQRAQSGYGASVAAPAPVDGAPCASEVARVTPAYVCRLLG